MAAVEVVQEVPSGTVTAVPTSAPAIQLDQQVVQVVGAVEATAKTVDALVQMAKGGGGNIWNVTSNLLALAALGVSLAHMTMGGQTMDDRLDRIELRGQATGDRLGRIERVLTYMAKKNDPEMVDFIDK